MIHLNVCPSPSEIKLRLKFPIRAGTAMTILRRLRGCRMGRGPILASNSLLAGPEFRTPAYLRSRFLTKLDDMSLQCHEWLRNPPPERRDKRSY